MRNALCCPWLCLIGCFVCTGSLSSLGVSRFCQKYPAVLGTLQRSVLELVCKYQKTVLG